MYIFNGFFLFFSKCGKNVENQSVQYCPQKPIRRSLGKTSPQRLKGPDGPSSMRPSYLYAVQVPMV